MYKQYLTLTGLGHRPQKLLLCQSLHRNHLNSVCVKKKKQSIMLNKLELSNCKHARGGNEHWESDVTVCDFYLLCLCLNLTAWWQSSFSSAGVLLVTRTDRQIIHFFKHFWSSYLVPCRSPLVLQDFCCTLKRKKKENLGKEIKE